MFTLLRICRFVFGAVIGTKFKPFDISDAIYFTNEVQNFSRWFAAFCITGILVNCVVSLSLQTVYWLA